jgi:16S rRNA (uracil1498-N3)-methyltransferase
MPSVKNKDATLASFLKYNKLKLKDKILVLIGPEGGFTDQEIRQAKKEKINVLSLGSRTLRTETACIFAMSVLSFYMENNIK